MIDRSVGAGRRSRPGLSGKASELSGGNREREVRPLPPHTRAIDRWFSRKEQVTTNLGDPKRGRHPAEIPSRRDPIPQRSHPAEIPSQGGDNTMKQRPGGNAWPRGPPVARRSSGAYASPHDCGRSDAPGRSHHGTPPAPGAQLPRVDLEMSRPARFRDCGPGATSKSQFSER